jgi:ribosomal protein S18 acetylase RimI-like enzyme
MVVDPDFQRQGAGRMLVKWGTEIADSMKVEVRQRSPIK